MLDIPSQREFEKTGYLHETWVEEEMTSHKQPPSLDHFHHLAVVVPNIAEGVDWYTKNFHCTIDYLDTTWALLGFSNTKLALVLPDEHPAHFAITHPNADSFGKLTTHRDGLSSIYIKDVAGNALEILQDNGKALSTD